MLRRLAVFALILGLGGCGGVNEEAEELKVYVAKMQELESYTKKISDSIALLDEPSVQISIADLAAGRVLIDDYIAAVEKFALPEYDDLRRAYNNYVRKVNQAKELAADSGRELKAERGNVAIALRHIEKMTDQHFNSGVDLLWVRQKMPGEMPLKWPR